MLFRAPILIFVLAGFAAVLSAQTDETIYREFQFDFSTPGARANGMGRAFVGLADEATAGYSNPAGLGILGTPELYLEWRDGSAFYPASPQGNDRFIIDPFAPSVPQASRFDLAQLGFLSYSFSYRNTHFSLYYVNNLDYRRPLVDETTSFIHVDGWGVNLINQHNVRRISINTVGFSASRNFGKLDVGFSIGLSTLEYDFSYNNTVNAFFVGVRDLLASNAEGETQKASIIGGLLYQIHPDLRVGLSAKIHPRFTMIDRINSFEFPESQFPDGKEIPVTFKVPDSFQIGFGYQPSDRWTFLLDLDWIQYRQLIDDITLISQLPFTEDDYTINESPDIRFGGEYFLPSNGINYALRFGAFLDPDHKTRFIGEAAEGQPDFAYEIQRLIFNNQPEDDNLGYTVGLGVVLNNKWQLDAAYVDSDRFKRAVVSFLYRF